jgi:hypothetical protein
MVRAGVTGKRTTPEGAVLAGCLRYLEIRGIYHWRNSVGALQVRPGQWYRFGLKGSSDIMGVLPSGRFLAGEVKAPRGRLSSEQRQFLEDVRNLGGLAVVVKSWRELDNALRAGGYISDGPLFEEGKN